MIFWGRRFTSTARPGILWLTAFIVPIIVLFFFTQKIFVRGIATTGSKN